MLGSQLSSPSEDVPSNTSQSGRSRIVDRSPAVAKVRIDGEAYRFSLERVVGKIVRDSDGKWQRDRASLGDPITNKTAAETERYYEGVRHVRESRWV